MSSFNYKQQQQRDFEWWKSEATNKQRQPPNPPAPPGHRKWKTCGHQDCSLNTTMCCSCSDRRPVRAGYSSYVDGQGEVFTADRAEHYCPTCKLAPTRIPVPPPMPPPPPPAPSPARSLNLTELQLIASVTCMGIAEDLAIRVYRRLKPDVSPARLTADYLVNYILEDPEFIASTFTSIPSPSPSSTPAFVPPPAPPLFKPLAQPPPGRTNSLFSRMPNSLFDSPPSSPPSSPPLFPPPSPPSIFTPSTATNKPPVSSLFDDIDSPPPSPSSLSTLSLPPFFNPFITDPFSDLPPPPLKPAQFPPPSLPLPFSLPPPPPPVAAITETTTVTTTRTTTASESSCIVCFNSTINSVVIPCGHLAMCFPCAQNVKRVHKECPVCRRTMAEVYQTYHV